MAQDADQNDPSIPCGAYEVMAPRWRLLESVLGGTETMREAGEELLPRYEEETETRYQNRLASAVLVNRTEQTLEMLTGKPFSEPVRLEETIPDILKNDIFKDIDFQGNGINTFARSCFREGVAKGFTHILIDMPRPEEKEGPRTLEDDRKEGIRPYCVNVYPENVIALRTEVLNGVERIIHARILETYTEVIGFQEVEKQQIRVIEPGLQQLWRVKDTKGKREVWGIHEEWETGIDFVPMVTFYAVKREGVLLAKPPLLDLAYLNVAHWQSTSDQRQILSVTRFPILGCSGVDGEVSEEKVVVGPYKVLYSSDYRGKFYYVEHSGSAIKSGQDDLDKLDSQMQGYGAEFLKKKPGNQTATARALDSAESQSDLDSMVLLFEETMSQVVSMLEKYLELEPSQSTIRLRKGHTLKDMDSVGMSLLKDARSSKDISREAFLEALKDRGLLPSNFSIQDDWAKIEKEYEFQMKQLAETKMLESKESEESEEHEESEEEIEA